MEKPTQDDLFEHLRGQAWKACEFIEIYSPKWDSYGNWDLTYSRRTIRKNAIASIIELDEGYYQIRRLKGNFVSLELLGIVGHIVAAGSYELFRTVLVDGAANAVKYRHGQDTSQ